MLFLPWFNLRRGFSKYFRYVPALTPELFREVYRIRHDVYCEDLKFEQTRADRQETDSYDEHSLYGLVQSVATSEYVGCARLILPNPKDPSQPFPVERMCAETIDRSIFDPSRIPRNTVAEVSRLAVIAAYRRRKGENRQPAPVSKESFGSITQPRFPYIPFSLYFGCAALARHCGIEHVLVLTEPRLANHFRKLGMSIRTIGGGVEHRGLRVPSVINAKTFPEDIHRSMRPLYKLIEEEVERAFAALESKGSLDAIRR
jgi:N-acyl amino acid synthase of PEP-CTERM/exosortase system